MVTRLHGHDTFPDGLDDGPSLRRAATEQDLEPGKPGISASRLMAQDRWEETLRILAAEPEHWKTGSSPGASVLVPVKLRVDVRVAEGVASKFQLLLQPKEGSVFGIRLC